MHRLRSVFVAAVASCLFFGCVAQVRGSRVQKPYYQAPTGTRVALVSIDVPPWVAARAAKNEDPRAQLRGALLNAFQGGHFQVEDQLSAGYLLPIGPDTAPQVFPTAAAKTEIGKAYAFDADGLVQAWGAPPILWGVASAPEGFAVDETTGRISWTPSATGKQEVTLTASNAHGQSDYTFEVEVVEAGRAKSVALAQPHGAALAPDQAFVGHAPQPVPDSVQAPLLLGVQVLDWSESTETIGQTKRRWGHTDVVYSMWTRDGRHVETRRVQVKVPSTASFKNAVKFVPARDYWMTWEMGGELPVHTAALSNQLFPSIAAASASGFAWPFGDQKIWFSVALDESSPALKPGIELSNKKDFQGAYKAFEAAAQAEPTLAGAWFNMGVMQEVMGDDAAALEHYRKAYGIKQDKIWRMQLDAAENRLKQRVSLDLP